MNHYLTFPPGVPSRSGMPPPPPGMGIDRKRPAPQELRAPPQMKNQKRKKKIADKILPQRVRNVEI